jgi:hypothetical protein
VEFVPTYRMCDKDGQDGWDYTTGARPTNGLAKRRMRRHEIVFWNKCHTDTRQDADANAFEAAVDCCERRVSAHEQARSPSSEILHGFDREA